MLGHNYHMPEIQAAIGWVQLKKLPKFLARRRENARRLTAKLKENNRLQLPNEPKGYRHSWYLYTVRLKNAKKMRRDKIVEKLHKRGIGAEVYYRTPYISCHITENLESISFQKRRKLQTRSSHYLFILASQRNKQIS